MNRLVLLTGATGFEAPDFNKFENQRIGILGRGYIGNHLVRALRQVFEAHGLNCEILTYGRNLAELFETELDYLINAAGNTGDFRNQIAETVESNVALSLKLIQHARVKRKLILLSSARVYGFEDELLPHSESEILSVAPNSLDFIYDGSKLILESLAYQVKDRPFNIHAIRLTNVYGRFGDLDESTLLKKMIKHAREKTLMEIDDSGRSSKDYVYIDDALSALIRLLLNDVSATVINVGSGTSTTLGQIASLIGLRARFKSVPAKHCPVSVDLAKSQLGYIARMPIKTGLPLVTGGEEYGSYKIV